MGSKDENVFEGNINCARSTIQWLVRTRSHRVAKEAVESLALSVPDAEADYLCPPSSPGAPYWDSGARASVTGMTRGTKKAHVVRAAEESIAYQIKDILDLMVSESGADLRELRVDGGPTKDAFLMQFQADILDIPVARSAVEELSATGAARMAGLAVGFWQDKEELNASARGAETYRRSMGGDRAARLYAGWKEAVSARSAAGERSAAPHSAGTWKNSK
jgi:glycerol kinase